MYVSSEKLQISRSVLYVCFACLLIIALIGAAKPESKKPAEPLSEPVAVTKGMEDAPTVFEAIDREAVVGLEITKDRAFLGSPPPMPHKGLKQGECLQCHAPENDIAKKWRSIRPLAHQMYTQCLQCHVEQVRPEVDLFVDSEFVGLDFPGGGSQDNDYAPPTVPHKVFMRENCLSCHGETGYAEFRTPHPERTQCLQCHVPEAAIDYSRPK